MLIKNINFLLFGSISVRSSPRNSNESVERERHTLIFFIPFPLAGSLFFLIKYFFRVCYLFNY